MRAFLVFTGLVLAVCFASGAFAAAAVQKQTITEKRANYTLDVAYPRTGLKSVDAVLEAWAKGVAHDFLDMAKEATAEPGPWAGELSYEVVRNDSAMIVVVFTWYTYTGGAHPNSTFETFNFLLPDGAQLELAELFTRQGIDRISAISVARLKKTLGGPDGMSDIDWIKRGAGPNAHNFAAFALLPRELQITFDAYQVAAYAAGPQEVRIPLSQLKDVMRPDPRAPVASFDCALARSDVEQAVCSTRDLARLDRHVAEAYDEALMWADEKPKREAVRAEQRAWLARRDAMCLRAGQPLVACLMGAYQQRLKVLQGGPGGE
ncbi:MAG: DUF4163 domain-containing protein [Alphaproteobacteria bacterium]|nr:DUF4163 domain-containing protein [Alphaproteobacteria bacterium]